VHCERNAAKSARREARGSAEACRPRGVLRRYASSLVRAFGRNALQLVCSLALLHILFRLIVVQRSLGNAMEECNNARSLYDATRSELATLAEAHDQKIGELQEVRDKLKVSTAKVSAQANT